MHINAKQPLIINSIQVNVDSTQDVTAKIEGRTDAIINATNSVRPAPKSEPDLNVLAPKFIQVEYQYSSFLDGPLKHDPERRSSEAQMMLTHSINMMKLGNDIQYGLSEAKRDIAAERPDLAAKAWDFSLDKNNNVVILHNGDLTKKDEGWLSNTIAQSEIQSQLVHIKDALIGIVENERGEDLYSKGIGRYALSADTFSQIMRLGDFLTKTNGADFQQYFIEQLQARAEVKYNQLTYAYLEKDGTFTHTSEKRTPNV